MRERGGRKGFTYYNINTRVYSYISDRPGVRANEKPRRARRRGLFLRVYPRLAVVGEGEYRSYRNEEFGPGREAFIEWTFCSR